MAARKVGTPKPYEEIGAIFNGNEVKIRVPKSSKKTKRLTPSQEGLLQRCTCLEDEDVCPPTCGIGGDEDGGPRNQMIFKVPDDMCAANSRRNADNSELVYSRRERAGMACDVTPADAPSGVRATKMLHPNKDVFVLQIGRQTDEPQRSGNIEVELITPKGPPKERQPSHSCKHVQCSEPEPAPTGGSKKGSKKAKKNKKGK